MWIADQWKDYEVIDTSAGEKLERWGNYILVRPDPQVIWNLDKKHPGWKKKNFWNMQLTLKAIPPTLFQKARPHSRAGKGQSETEVEL